MPATRFPETPPPPAVSCRLYNIVRTPHTPHSVEDETPPDACQLRASRACVKAALSVRPAMCLPGFCLDLALSAPTEMMASLQPPPRGDLALSTLSEMASMPQPSPRDDDQAPFRLLSEHIRELLLGPDAELSTTAFGLAPDELVEAHARLSQAVAQRLTSKGPVGGDMHHSSRSSSGGAACPSNSGSYGSGSGAMPGSGSGSAAVSGGCDWFLLWIAGVMGRQPPSASLELLSALSRSPACVYWWPAFGAAVLGDAQRLALCSCLQVVLSGEQPAAMMASSPSTSSHLMCICLQVVLAGEQPAATWAACRSAGLHPGHLASKWLNACFFGYIPGALAMHGA